jgi:16S rRNA (adenine1518-N6/adenine1519-N6)-dimethyltransferase
MGFINDTNYLDQHFLIDKDVESKFIEEASLSKNDIIVEIGPGKGIISDKIAKKVKHLTCIEKDRKLSCYLDNLTKNNLNVSVIYDNALKTYIPKCDKIITSLPYSIIEPFIEKLIKCDFKEALLIVGNNYASKVITKEPNKLSLLTNCFFKIEKIMEITPDSFEPKPRVMSAMIRLKPISSIDLIDNFSLFIFREIFFNRTKKVKNSLIEAFIRYKKINDLIFTQKQSKKLLEKLDLEKSLLESNIENIPNEYIKIIYNKLNEISKDN